MDWFERLTGFRETGYEETRAKLFVDSKRLRCTALGASYAIGELELVSLYELRKRVKSARGVSGRLDVNVVTGDVQRMHLPENRGALFQVASQCNLLEMASPDVTPEDGVTRYQYDHTQGPACAIAAGAATIYRNYFVPVAGQHGQTATRQIDALADLGDSLSEALNMPVRKMWKMRNGYALGAPDGIHAVSRYLHSVDPDKLDSLRGKLRIGVHSDIGVTYGDWAEPPLVSQAFCSALPIAYCPSIPRHLWEPFAYLILEAAYEATMWAAVANAQRGASKVVFLTLLGGGAFGNDSRWIFNALRRALMLTASYDLQVKLVSFGTPPPEVLAIADEFC